MSTIQTNAIVDASGGNTATVNGVTPNTHSVRGRNLIINGAMQVAQRGTTVTIANTGAYSSPDRFRIQHNANTTSTVAQVSDVPASTNFKYSLKFTNGAGETRNDSDYARLYTRLEGYDIHHLKLGTSSAKGFTLQFWVKSSLTGTFGVGFTGSDSASNGVYSSSYTISSANTWEYKTVTVPAATITSGTWTDTNGVGISIHWDLGEGPTRSNSVGWQAGDSPGHMGLTGGVKLVETTGATLNLTGVKLEEGLIATEYDHRPYAEELTTCQRYYIRRTIDADNDYPGHASGWASTTGTHNFITQFEQQMRSAPTFSSSGNFRMQSTVDSSNSSSLSAANISPVACRLSLSSSAYAGTNGAIAVLQGKTIGGYIAFDAEL